MNKDKRILQCLETISIDDCGCVVEMRCEKERKHKGSHECKGFDCDEKPFYLTWDYAV